MPLKKIVILTFFVISQLSAASQYRINVKIAGGADSIAALYRYTAHGSEMFQSKRLGAVGIAIFEDHHQKLSHGMYVLKACGREFPFLVSHDKNFLLNIEYDLKNANSMRYSESKENQDYLKYLNYQEKFNTILQKCKQNYNYNGSELRSEIANLLDTLKLEQEQFVALMMSNNPNTLLSSVIEASQAIWLLSNQLLDDDSAQWQQDIDEIRTIVLNNVNLDDNRLINSPILPSMLTFFFRQILAYMPIPEIIASANALLAKVSDNREMYRYILTWLYKNYTESHLDGDYLIGKAMSDIMLDTSKVDWLTEEERKIVLNNVKSYGLNPVGSIATDLVLQTIGGASQSLHMVRAPYTILYFFNPQCQSCRVVTPLVYAQYLRYKSKGLQVYAVYTDRSKDLWEQYLSDNKFNGFINVWDANADAGIDEKYSLHSIPHIYVLDADKKILHKDVSVDELQNILFIAFLNKELAE